MFSTMRCFYLRIFLFFAIILRGDKYKLCSTYQRFCIAILLVISSLSISAQVVNDDCTGAVFIKLQRGVTFCENYSSLGAQPSGLAAPGCFQGNIF